MTIQSPIPGRQSGASLIEVLISLFLVAVTMLGLLGLQLRALGLQRDSLDRRTAAVLVSGFADHITMNFQGFFPSPNSTFAGSMAPTVSTLPGLPACATSTGSCNATDAAAREFALFAATVRARLPDGGVWVTSNANRAEITVAWRDIRRTDPASGGETTVDAVCNAVGLTDFAFRCYSARVAP
jgi:type IV pilus assembly protein PilV